MRPIIKILSIVTSALFVWASASSMPKDSELSQLRVEGTQLVNDTGEAVVLRGVSYSWHNWWPRFYNKKTVKWLVEDWGVDIVRAAMGIHFDYTRGTYNENPKRSVKRISKIVEGAIENDIYVIIDFHSHHLELELAKVFFKQMAEEYGEYPNVIYEIFNEPIEQSWEDVKAYAEEVIAVIRSIDPDNVILVGNPNWDQDLHIVADNPIEGVSNIMYTLHYYAATHDDFLRERGDYALSKGVPIFISESAAMDASGDGPLDYDEWKIWRDWAEERKISWISWSISDKNETSSFLLPSAKSRGGWTEKEMSESGIATRRLLREKAGLE